MSAKVFDRLSPTQQAAIQEAGLRTETFMRGAWAFSEASSLARLRDLMTIVTDVDKGPFVEAVTPMLKVEAERLGVSDEVVYLLETGPKF